MVTLQKRGKLCVLLASLAFLIIVHPSFLQSDTGKKRPHDDKSNLPRGCGSCHIGHGKFNTPMLPETRDMFCFRCHGNQNNIEKTKKSGDLASHMNPFDMQKEFEKTYTHPIQTSYLHRNSEILPELDSSIPRHVACGDCHHYHLVSGDNKMSGIKGVNGQRAKVSVQRDYELCFNCHAFSANLPVDQTNKAELFDITNPSFHPVIAQGKNSDVPSLRHPLTTSSIINCTDCHNSDDSSGPKGPHGSAFKHILYKNFEASDGPEDPVRYELCYSCHRRESILGNESFTYHDLHIGQVGLSCKACHNPHGNRYSSHLIDFSYSHEIRPSATGRLEFIDFGERTGECFLNCHNQEHNPAVYPLGADEK